MALFPHELETDRLRLVALDGETLDPLDLYEHVRVGAPDIERVTRYLTWEPHEHPKETAEFLDRCAEQFEAGEGAQYAIYPREDEDRADERSESADRASSAELLSADSRAAQPRDDGRAASHAGEFAGLGGFGVDWDRQVATLGTWLREPFWGRGYSGERARALMAVAFERLDLDCVAVTCDVENENSYRAITRYVERAGGREEGRLRNHERYPDGPADVYRFTVTAAEWAGDG